MWDFLRKLTDVDPEGRNCSDCGHPAISHYSKVLPGEPNWMHMFEKWTRLNCKKCNCVKFR
jgi:hypothetical protein